MHSRSVATFNVPPINFLIPFFPFAYEAHSTGVCCTMVVAAEGSVTKSGAKSAQKEALKFSKRRPDPAGSASPPLSRSAEDAPPVSAEHVPQLCGFGCGRDFGLWGSGQVFLMCTQLHVGPAPSSFES